MGWRVVLRARRGTVRVRWGQLAARLESMLGHSPGVHHVRALRRGQSQLGTSCRIADRVHRTGQLVGLRVTVEEDTVGRQLGRRHVRWGHGQDQGSVGVGHAHVRWGGRRRWRM